MQAPLGSADTISRVENVVRDLIEEVLSSSIGTDWLPQCGVTPDRLAIWEQRYHEERKRREGGASSDRRIYFSDITDLPVILKRHWELFKSCFGDQRTLLVYLARLTDFRIAIMHGRQLLPFEEQLVEGMAGEIRNKVTIWRSQRDEDPELFARIEQVVDSFGNVARPGSAVHSKLILHPGDTLQMQFSGWDPDGGQLEWLVLIQSDRRLQDWSTADRFAWQIGDEDIRDPMGLNVYMRGSTPYHRRGDYDDAVSLYYRILPRRK